MFTGIIDHCAKIQSLQQTTNGLALKIETQFDELQLGESIAVDGICLTVTAWEKPYFSCAVSPETLAVTAAKYFQKDKLVNLERALALGDRLGGHFVSGHVDQTALLVVREQQAEYMAMTFSQINSQQQHLLTHKGSVTLNGVSLTINAVTADSLEVMLIPHTLERTNLQYLKVGDSVNLEFDMMAKLVADQVKTLHANGRYKDESKISNH